MSSQKHTKLTPLENPVQLAVIGAAHGIRGEVRVKTYTGDPLDLGSYGLLYDAAGKAYDVLTVRPSKTVVVVRFRGVDDRNAAEALNGTELFVEHSQLPQKLDEDEFYYTDLIGLEVRDAEAKTYGTVSAVFNFGGGDVLEIKETSKKPVLIPFTKISVPEIEMEQGYILIDPLAAGLLTSDEDEASDRAAQMAAEQNDAEQNSAGRKADDDGWVR